MPFFLAAADETLPDDMLDVLLWPVLLTLVGLAIFYGALWLEAHGRKATWKWVALAPLVVATFMGAAVLYRWMSDAVYVSVVSYGAAKKMMVAHWAALLVPLIGLAAVSLYNLYRDRLHFVSED